MTFIRCNTILIDLQFINGNNKQLFVKELSYMLPDTANVEHFIFKPPYPEQELNDSTKHQLNYCYNNINGFKWNDGITDYLELFSILNDFKDYDIVVKGLQKKKFLEKYLPNTPIFNLDMKKSINQFYNYKTKCQIHEKNDIKRCGISNVLRIFVYMEKSEQFI